MPTSRVQCPFKVTFIQFVQMCTFYGDMLFYSISWAQHMHNTICKSSTYHKIRHCFTDACLRYFLRHHSKHFHMCTVNTTCCKFIERKHSLQQRMLVHQVKRVNSYYEFARMQSVQAQFLSQFLFFCEEKYCRLQLCASYLPTETQNGNAHMLSVCLSCQNTFIHHLYLQICI